MGQRRYLDTIGQIVTQKATSTIADNGQIEGAGVFSHFLLVCVCYVSAAVHQLLHTSLWPNHRLWFIWDDTNEKFLLSVSSGRFYLVRVNSSNILIVRSKGARGANKKEESSVAVNDSKDA